LQNDIAKGRYIGEWRTGVISGRCGRVSRATEIIWERVCASVCVPVSDFLNASLYALSKRHKIIITLGSYSTLDVIQQFYRKMNLVHVKVMNYFKFK
jgi:hypothetical protein